MCGVQGREVGNRQTSDPPRRRTRYACRISPRRAALTAETVRYGAEGSAMYTSTPPIHTRREPEMSTA